MSTQPPTARSRRRIALSTLAAAGLLTGAGVAVASTASASTSGGAAPSAVTHGTCTNAAAVTMQLRKSDPGRIEAGFEIDHAKAGTVWAIRLKHNTTAYFTGQRTTRAGGSLSVDRVLHNLPGTDTVSGRARNLSSGQVCTVSGRI